jgi:hypothetical protein
MSAKTVVIHRIGLYWGPYGPLLMGRGLDWALEVRPIAHCWLGFGPGPRAHLWALRKSSFGRLDEGCLAVDNVLEAVDELLYLSGGDSACALGRRVNFTISRSFSYYLGGFDRYSRLEILN